MYNSTVTGKLIGSAFALFAMVLIGAGIGSHFSLNKSEWASWVQAIGSIVAILVAIGVSYYQYAMARKLASDKERQETLALLQGLRDEIDVMAEGFARNVGAALDQTKDGEIFNRKWHPAERPFILYEACAGQLGKIPDADLRKSVIRTFSMARGLVLSIRSNTYYLEQLVSANIRWNATKAEFDKALVEDYRASLVEYGDKLREGYRVAKIGVEDLKAAIDKYLRESACE